MRRDHPIPRRARAAEPPGGPQLPAGRGGWVQWDRLDPGNHGARSGCRPVRPPTEQPAEAASRRAREQQDGALAALGPRVRAAVNAQERGSARWLDLRKDAAEARRFLDDERRAHPLWLDRWGKASDITDVRQRDDLAGLSLLGYGAAHLSGHMSPGAGLANPSVARPGARCRLCLENIRRLRCPCGTRSLRDVSKFRRLRCPGGTRSLRGVSMVRRRRRPVARRSTTTRCGRLERPPSAPPPAAAQCVARRRARDIRRRRRPGARRSTTTVGGPPRLTGRHAGAGGHSEGVSAHGSMKAIRCSRYARADRRASGTTAYRTARETPTERRRRRVGCRELASA